MFCNVCIFLYMVVCFVIGCMLRNGCMDAVVCFVYGCTFCIWLYVLYMTVCFVMVVFFVYGCMFCIWLYVTEWL